MKRIDMAEAQSKRREDFLMGLRRGIMAFFMKPKDGVTDYHMNLSFVKDWVESDWAEIPANVRSQVTESVVRFRTVVADISPGNLKGDAASESMDLLKGMLVLLTGQ
jgi:hypothetical protein